MPASPAAEDPYVVAVRAAYARVEVLYRQARREVYDRFADGPPEESELDAAQWALLAQLDEAERDLDAVRRRAHDRVSGP